MADTETPEQTITRVLAHCGIDDESYRMRDVAAEVWAALAPHRRHDQAQALRDFADQHVKAQTAGRIAEDLHAEADRLEQGGE